MSDRQAPVLREWTPFLISAAILAWFGGVVGVRAQSEPGASPFPADPRGTGSYDAPGAPQLHGLVWKSLVEGRQCPVAVAEGVLCAGRSVYPGLGTFDIRTGKKLWDIRSGIVGAAPAIVNGVVYVAYGNGTENGGGVRALDLKTGKVLWNFATPSNFQDRISPAVRAGVVYLVGWDGILYAVDARTGREKWRLPFGDSRGPAPTSPAIDGDTLYFGAGARGLFAVDLATGRAKWMRAISSDPAHSGKSNTNISQTPAVADGTVYFGTGASVFYAVDAGSGAVRWYNQGLFTDGLNPGNFTAPAVGPGMVYLGSNEKRGGHMRALDRNTGREIWNVETDGTVVSAPSLARGVLYFGGGATPVTGLGNFIYAVDAGTGATIWKFETDQPHPGEPRFERWPISQPVIADDSVYFTCWTKAYRLH